MNNPSPFVPQGSFLEQKNQSRARVRMAVSFILAIHFIGLMALLMIGCQKPKEPEVPPVETNAAPVFDTNIAPAFDTNVAPMTYIAPMPETNIAPVIQSAATEYTIVKGDTFDKIAKDHGVTVRAIQDANPGVDPKKLQIGKVIHVPPPVASITAPKVNTPSLDATTGGEQTYKVKSGDTLTKIAKDHGVTIRALRSANNLTTDKIKVGDVLKIPAKTSEPVTTPGM